MSDPQTTRDVLIALFARIKGVFFAGRADDGTVFFTYTNAKGGKVPLAAKTPEELGEQVRGKLRE